MHSNGSIWDELQLWHEVYIKIYVFLALQLFDSLQHYSRQFSQFFPSICTPKYNICMYIRFKTFFYVVRHHCFLSSHWPSFRFLSFMAFFIPSIQFFFGLPRALFCFGIHFIAILGSLSSAILWTWPYHESWFFSISFIILSSSPICCLIVTFLILSFLDILEDLLRASISVANTIFKCNMIFNGGQQRN